MKIIYISLAMALLASGCHRPMIVKKKITIPSASAIQSTQKDSTPRITIWVHGTKLMKKLSDVLHATPQQGLLHCIALKPPYRMASMLAALNAADPGQFPQEHCYAFGWSGILSFEAREKAAQELYTAIEHLNAQYINKYDKKPHITLITHSHGGNVVLNLAKIKKKDSQLKLRAILLACPVQHETKENIQSNFFEKIYSLYSTADFLQVADPQGLYKRPNNKPHLELSGRQFPYCPNVRQAKLKMNGHGIMHGGFIACSFIKLLPQLIETLDSWELEEPIQEHQERLLIVSTQ